MPLPTNSFLVGTLNLLGDAYNPFEFLPRGGNDAAAARMISNYQTIEKKALELTFHDFKGLYDDIRGLPDVGCAEECEKLVSQLAVHSANNDGRIWGFFQGDILRNDNKIINKRLNLICLATLPVDNALLGDICSPDLHQQSHIMRRTATEARATVVAAFGALFTAYSRDYCLLLWDLVCCAAALASKEAYVLICSESVLNPENMPAIAQHFVSRISSLASSETRPIIALQEWPSDGSARRECYQEAFAQRSCAVLAGSDSVAIAYDTSLSVSLKHSHTTALSLSLFTRAHTHHNFLSLSLALSLSFFLFFSLSPSLSSLLSLSLSLCLSLSPHTPTCAHQVMRRSHSYPTGCEYHFRCCQSFCNLKQSNPIYIYIYIYIPNPIQ